MFNESCAKVVKIKYTPESFAFGGVFMFVPGLFEYLHHIVG